MRLKSLELKGFKSFANETVIHFDEDVIGIVGPNGSGKSNIVDAIRWVLGEQKGKELRLETMGDVIFNGTKKRKPGNVAQVSITFENTRNLLPTEFQSVTISRLLYRSGESEYRLNGVTCRLKDIHSLLMDTGIGSNSYAIIALGMVDDILNNKDNARRRMFEQAAGIAKYKRRKHETMLRLKSTSSDLDRIEDLLYEIEGNMKTLEKQARRTQRFVDIKKLYKDESIALTVRKSGQLREQYKDLEKQVQMEKDTYQQHEAKLRKREAELEQLRKSNLDEEKQLSDKQRSLNMLVGKVRNLESEKSLKEQKIAFLQESQKKLQSQIDTSVTKAGRIEEELAQNAESLKEAQQKLQIAGQELSEKSQQKSVAEANYNSAQKTRTKTNDTQEALEKEVLQLQREQYNLQAQIVQLKETEKQVHSEKNLLDDEIVDLSEKQSYLSEQIKTLEAQIVRAEQAEQERISHKGKLENKLSESRESLQIIHRKLDAKQNEWQLLKELVAKLEGFPESVRFLNQSDKWKPNAQLLSDILLVDPEYRVQLEHLLEPWLNHYVVDLIDDALAAIELLSNAQKGKAGFIVLDHVRKEKKTDSTSIQHAQPILEFVQVDKKYETLMHQLLGNVFIVEKSPADPVYTGDTFKDLILMDKQGKVFKQGFAISGGSVGLFEGKKIGRKKNLEQLEKEIKTLEKQKAELEKALDGLRKAISEVDSPTGNDILKGLRLQHRDIDQQRIECNATLRHKTERIETLSKRADESRLALKASREQLDEIGSKLNVSEQKLSHSEERLDDAERDFSEVMHKLSGISAEYNAAHITHVQAKSEVHNLDREIHLRSNQLRELKESAEADRIQMEDDLAMIGSIQRELEQIGSELIDLYAEKKAGEQALSDAEQGYFSARNTIHEIEEKVKSINRELQNSQYLINQLKDEYNGVKFTLTSLSERLDIEFHVKLEEALKREIDETMPLEELETKVDKYRSRIENFGEINPMAVEAYEEMKERYDTINDQKIDILEAKESLLETIKEIEATATSQFMESFEEVREYFIEVFRNLFTEDDSCDLILENPDDPLESEIQIIAKPKGKRPKTLSQLSGGEKTLTAIAVLFALYLLKPAPFCVFDEVDAPLDDANIEKFNKIVKKFSQTSQFVIVTHNKQTMAEVDIMYGVYMEEQGISNLSQVDFRAFEHEPIYHELN